MIDLHKYNQNTYVHSLPDDAQKHIVEKVKNLAQENFYSIEETNESIEDALNSRLDSVIYIFDE